MKRILIALVAVLAVAGGAAAAVVATQSTVTELITVPYTIGGQSGQVVLTDTDEVQTVTETVTVTTTAPPPTTTSPPPPPPPPPPTTTSPPPATTLTPSQLQARATAGATVANVTVSGSGQVDVTAANVTFDHITATGVTINVYGSGFTLSNSSISGGNVNLLGADNVLLVGNTLDGLGRTTSNKIWDAPAQNGVNGFVIRDNIVRNFHGADCTVHAEGFFIGGYSQNGLIEGNTFENNGCTGHLFFSFFGSAGQATAAAYPNHICVRGNTFGPLFAETFFDINFRAEIPNTQDIKLQPDATSNRSAFYGAC